ncbi:MAG TPA: EAL domain-containing protein [Thermoanaerobaculia bacterium]|nr:EAL domain-containing protein [Thermoanaerobaculia bacterium]
MELIGYLAQAACALLVAIVLRVFYRHYRRGYLWHWSWSWWAFTVFLVGAAVAIQTRGGAPVLVRITVSTIGLAGGFTQTALLLFGTWEVSTGRTMSRQWSRQILAAIGILTLGLVLLTQPLPPVQRLAYRIGGHSLLAGIGFFFAAWGVLRGRLGKASLGRKLLGGAFLVYGVQQIHYMAIVVAELFGHHLTYDLLLVGLDLVLQIAMGFGMVIWLLEDERKQVIAASEQIEHLAYHDALTGLPNRNLFVDHLRLAVALAGREHRQVAVLFLDLDRFKMINDSLGHGAGDELLRTIADRLRSGLRQGDTVARLGGDEFTVLLPEMGDERNMLYVAEKLLDLIRLPLILQGREIVITGSVGISRFPHDGDVPEELLKRADVAMYQAKQGGRDGYQIYLPSMDADALERLSLENDLRRALTHDELLLYYQPILDSQTGRIEGVEALLRWQHPERGLLGPGEFLSIAEQSGLSNPLDLWVLRTALGEIRTWHEDGAHVRLTVNLSARAFQQPDLVERVHGLLVESGLPAQLLELEITETLAMQNAEVSLGVLRALKDLGVRIAIDDFGTGYSSLSYLRTFPIDTLKIDESFVRSLNIGDVQAEIPAAMIALAHSLDIRVVGEGVEEEVQWLILREQGCDEVQGFLFSRPLPSSECRDLVMRQEAGEKVAVLLGEGA